MKYTDPDGRTDWELQYSQNAKVSQGANNLEWGDVATGSNDVTVSGLGKGGYAEFKGPDGTSIRLFKEGTYNLDAIDKAGKEYAAKGKEGATFMVGVSGDAAAVIGGGSLQLGLGASKNGHGETTPFVFGSASGGIDSVFDAGLSINLTYLSSGDYRDAKGVGSVAGVKMGCIVVGGFGSVMGTDGKQLGWTFTVGIGAAFESYYLGSVTQVIPMGGGK